MGERKQEVEDALATAISAAKGAVVGGFVGTINTYLSDNPQPQDFRDPLAMARSFAVMTGVRTGIKRVMKRVRGKEDVQSCMVAAFGSGAMYSLARGFDPTIKVGDMVATGLFSALLEGGWFKLREKFSEHQYKDEYNKTRILLSSLGLQNYEKNFKKGLLTDITLPLLTDRALREVQIPPGPRLQILDRVQRDPALKEARGASS